MPTLANHPKPYIGYQCNVALEDKIRCQLAKTHFELDICRKIRMKHKNDWGKLD